MKKLLLFLLIFIGSGYYAFAQLEVKPNSFKEVPGFVNINPDKQTDDNDKPYAVIKVKTENINDKQRRELTFQGDAQTFFELEYRDGEVWLYISYYATFIKISHYDLSSTEFYFPFDMKPRKGYELTLVNNTKPDIDEQKIISLIEERLENTNTTDTIVIQTEPVIENKQNSVFFMTVNGAYSNYGDLSYGLTIGSYKRIGWFISLMSNFNFNGFSYDYECNNDFWVGDYYPEYTGDEYYTSLSAMLGLVVRIAKPVALRIGAGYGIRNTVYGTVDGVKIRNAHISANGLDASLGVQLKFGAFVFSLDGVTTNFKIYETKIGIGFGI